MNPVASQNVCSLCEQAIRHGVGNLDSVPGLIKRIIKEELWRERKVPTGEIVRLDSFLELITAKPYKGWGTSLEKVEAVIRDDVEALDLWHKAITPAIGVNQHTKGHNNIMTLQGTSRAYTVSRLKKQRPDLFAQVKSGKLSANAAAITAGWRKKKTALEQLRHWWDKATAKERSEFMKDKI